MSSRTRRIVVAVVVVAAVAAGLLLANPPRPTAALLTVTAQRGEFVIDIATTGQIEAVESRSVSRKRVGGSWNAVQIVEMAPEGSRVQEGDFLVQLDPSEAKQQLEQARNDLLNAQAELERQRAESAARLAELESAVQNQRYSHEQARLVYDQMQYEAEVRRREQELELKKSELSLQEAQDRLAAQKVIAAAEHDKAAYEVRRAQMQVEQAEEALASLTITAPEAGLVVYRTYRGGKVKVGDQAWPGMDIIDLPDLSSMQVRTRVNETDVRRVDEGQPVEVTVDALAGQTFNGHVSRIATLARAEGEAKVKVFDVDVLLDEPGDDLRPGMTAQCRIITDRYADVVTVPLEAIRERDGQTLVRLADGEERAVTPGPAGEDRVVIESGLAAGDEVVLRGGPAAAAAGTTTAADDTAARGKEARP